MDCFAIWFSDLADVTILAFSLGTEYSKFRKSVIFHILDVVSMVKVFIKWKRKFPLLLIVFGFFFFTEMKFSLFFKSFSPISLQSDLHLIAAERVNYYYAAN